MARSVFDTSNEVDVIPLNTMIYSYAHNGYGRKALELFERMMKLGLQANDVTVLSVLLACNNSGLVDEGCDFFESRKGGDAYKRGAKPGFGSAEDTARWGWIYIPPYEKGSYSLLHFRLNTSYKEFMDS
ncbi:hypothetical protein DY000_02005704 [Brassica cretica]|uniref:Pentatricopeptide repeat-containing protein n=1 Tax=Brassica cretica TaxID=69181 RepID=A0ABQ7CI24_BRACR|nr:hypothetical protein DY000_02005704 [Brassica cretica]